MYTTVPVLDPNLDHFGFYLTLVVLSFVGLLICWAFSDIGFSIKQTRRLFVTVFVLWVSVIGFSFYKSYIVDVPSPTNTKVIATFKRYVVQSEGKHSHPAVFGEFIVPEGTLLLRLPDNHPVSERVVLYKN